MTTKPYSELLEQVEALAGATLATAERSRVKIFANRRARHAHRECPYWPRFLRVGEERIVSDSGLLPLEQTGLDSIDQIIRIHAQDPFKQDAAFEYTEYYEDSTGIQITGYQPAEKDAIVVSGVISADATGTYVVDDELNGGRNQYLLVDVPTYYPNGVIVYNETIPAWSLIYLTAANLLNVSIWSAVGDVETPDLATGWTPGTNATGTPVFTASTVCVAYVTYIAAPPTYGTGDGEESDVPEEWFEYMAQGAYADWLRSDGQTEKALAEEVIAEKLLNQQLEKVSRQNGNQVITRQLSHGNMQWR